MLLNKLYIVSKKLLEGLLKRKKGVEFYADELGVSTEQIKIWKKEIKNSRKETSQSSRIVSEDINYDKGTRTLVHSSDRPLTPEELEKVAGVDNLNTYIARTWLKSSDKGTWNYSIDVRYRINDFYTADNLQKKLKEIFPQKINKYQHPKVVATEKVLMCYIGDDHCGMVLKDSQYGNEHSETVYRGRLDTLYNEILALGETFSKLYVVSLGDELDGWSKMTTRQGHPLDSLSNKEQFDIYVESRKEFYDKLFTSGVAETYINVNQNNSNHSGLGFSYMANRALEFYLEARFENVFVIQTDKLIQVIEVGNHVFGLVHGKDDTHQKNPLPLNLDAKADAYLFEFYDKQGYSPSKHWVSTVKADIHKLNLNIGKHGRYVNIPSISSGSNWIEANFGNSQPGCLLEIVDPNSKNIKSIPVWF